MANKQLHELPPASALAPEDQLLVSHAGSNLTRRASLGNLPFRLQPSGSARTIAGKLGEVVSVKDFGAVGDGVADDSAAFQAALDQHTAVHVPAGSYRLDTEVQVKPRRRLHGAGRDVTVIDARGPRAFTFQRNEGAFRIDGDAGSDWCRSSLSGMRIAMTTGGIRVFGHEFRGSHLLFFGGAAPAGLADVDGWCVDLVDANECALIGHPGRLWRRQRACAARQRHPLALQPDRRQLRRQPTGRSVDQAGRAQHLRRPAAGQPSGPDQQRAARARADRTHPRPLAPTPCKSPAPARRSTRWPGPSAST